MGSDPRRLRKKAFRTLLSLSVICSENSAIRRPPPNLPWSEAVDYCLFPLPIVGKGVRSAREPTGIISSFDMKKPALAGYSHVEGRRPGRPLHCDLSPSPPFPRERGNRPENRQPRPRGG